LGDEYGWKQVHGDVFRPAAMPMLFATFLGTGYQLLVVTFAVILFTILGELYTERGSLLSTAIFVYAATSPINGYFGASIYAQMGGKVCHRIPGLCSENCLLHYLSLVLNSIKLTC
jgi:transmembrane 9 superfamily protein 3